MQHDCHANLCSFLYRMISRIAWIICCTVACTLPPIRAFFSRHRLDIPKVFPTHFRVLPKLRPLHTSRNKETIVTSTKSSPSVELFLYEEMGLSLRAADSLVSRYPGLAALSVKNNLRPAVKVFTEYGFAKEDVARIIHNVPAIMTHDAGCALPEKLAALQRMYECTTPELVELTSRAPFILTTSIDKNTRIADFFRNTVQLSPKQILQLMRVYPAAATAKVDILRRCWALLTRLYGFDETQARRIIIDCPMILSERMVNNIKDRLVFLSSELDVQSFPCQYIKDLTLKFPSFLYLDYDNKIGPNLAILRELLRLDANGTAENMVRRRRTKQKKPKGWDSELFLLDDCVVSDPDSHSNGEILVHTKQTEVSMQTSDLGRMLLRLPNLLKYRPSDLQKICNNAMLFLTGENIISNTTTRVSSFKCEELRVVSDNSVRVVEQYDKLMLGSQFIDETTRNEDVFTIAGSTDYIDKKRDISEVSDVVEDAVVLLNNSSRGIIDEWVHASTFTLDDATQGKSVHDLIYDIVHNYSTTNNSDTIDKLSNKHHATTTTNTTAPPTCIPAVAVYPFTNHSVAVQYYIREASHLTLSVSRACTAIRNNPGILAYRTERSQGVVAALTVSLGLSRAEVSKMVSTYYRLLALSVDGKLKDVLRLLAEAAVRCLAYTTGVSPNLAGTTELNTLDTVNSTRETHINIEAPEEPHLDHQSDIELYRSHPVRTMVREMVIRYPHILGSSIDKISERFAWAASENAPWDAYLACWRMSDRKYYTAARRLPKTRARKP